MKDINYFVDFENDLVYSNKTAPFSTKYTVEIFKEGSRYVVYLGLNDDGDTGVDRFSFDTLEHARAYAKDFI